MKKILPILAIFVIGFIFGLLCGKSAKRVVQEVRVERDTLISHDTIFNDKPIPVYITEVRTDTVRLALVDSSQTTVIRDSADVEVPITRKVYEDSTYRAVISGFRANLDSLWVYNTIKEITVTKTVKMPPKHWGLGVTAGPSLLVTPKGDIKGGLGVTGGLTYNF